VTNPNDLEINRRHWDATASWWVAPGERNWSAEPRWGTWAIPNSELPLLPEDMTGLEAIELGCGTGYVSGWMARRGATVTGVDQSAEQLATAKRLSGEHGVALTLLHGNAEAVPRPDQSYDFAISEYGAALWCDPYSWVPEAHRLLRTGGTLVALSTSSLVQVCYPRDGSSPVTDRLVGDYFGLHRQDWSQVEIDQSGVEFGLPVSGWFALFTDTGFEVVDFIEIQAPPGAEGEQFGVPAEWARRFPSEQVWRVRKR
jgi:SAM-dependent methyltransferase